MESILNKSFASFTGKTLRCSLSSIKIQDLRPTDSLKREPNAGAFPVKFPELPGTPFLNFFSQNTHGDVL